MRKSTANGRSPVTKQAAALKALLKSRKSRFATVAFVDLQGQLRGKTGERPRVLPFEDSDCDLLFFVEYAEGTNGGKWDPRRLFRRLLERAAAIGLFPTFAFEYEFRLFKESPESLRAKGFQNPELLNEVSIYGGVMHRHQSPAGLCLA